VAGDTPCVSKANQKTRQSEETFNSVTVFAVTLILMFLSNPKKTSRECKTNKPEQAVSGSGSVLTNNKENKMISVDWIMEYENGGMSDEDIITGFQHMIDDGSVWQLQGCYGRMAVNLIEGGHCTKAA